MRCTCRLPLLRVLLPYTNAGAGGWAGCAVSQGGCTHRSVSLNGTCSLALMFQVGCKLSLVLFQYCITANFYWLLVEGLHLHTLLVASFSPGRRFQAYLLIGWGKATPPPSAPSAARKPSRSLLVSPQEVPLGPLEEKLCQDSEVPAAVSPGNRARLGWPRPTAEQTRCGSQTAPEEAHL